MQIISTEYPQVYSIIQKHVCKIPTKIRFNNSSRNKYVKDIRKIPHLLEMRIERVKR